MKNTSGNFIEKLIFKGLTATNYRCSYKELFWSLKEPNDMQLKLVGEHYEHSLF